MIRSRCAILRGVSDPRRNLLTIALVTFCAAVLFGRLELGGVPAQAQTAALTALDYYEITPAPEGATGRVYLVQLGMRGPGSVDRSGPRFSDSVVRWDLP